MTTISPDRERFESRISLSQAIVPARVWPLRWSVALIIIGTARYISRDDFHTDDSSFQSIVEISTILIGSSIAVGSMLCHRFRPMLRAPFLMFLASMCLAFFFSVRSWNPPLSFVRGALLILILITTLALLSVYNTSLVLRNMISAYVFLLLLGIVIGMLWPDAFPLMLYDSGEETLRARLHILKIHPVALADECVICLIAGAPLQGTWIRCCRIILFGCLILTVGRAAIILGLPLYAVAQAASARTISEAWRRARAFLCMFALFVFMSVMTTTIIFGWNAAQNVIDTVTRLADATRENETLNGRTPLWTMLISDLSGENLYGYGVAGARYYLRTVNPWFSHSHNSILETIYMSGYGGLVFVLAGGLYALISALRHLEVLSARILLVALIYIFLAGMMNPSWYDTNSVFMLAIIFSCPWLCSGARSWRAGSCGMCVSRYGRSV